MHSSASWETSCSSVCAEAAEAVPKTHASARMPTAISARTRTGGPPLTRDDEREHEAEERERLGERDAQEHRGADHAGGLGLTGHGSDGVTHHDADADTRTDRSTAVDDATADCREPFD